MITECSVEMCVWKMPWRAYIEGSLRICQEKHRDVCREDASWAVCQDLPAHISKDKVLSCQFRKAGDVYQSAESLWRHYIGLSYELQVFGDMAGFDGVSDHELA